MQFTIVLRGPELPLGTMTYTRNPATGESLIGLNALQFARDEAGDPGLNPALVEYEPLRNWDLRGQRITVPEDVARRSGHFWDESTVDIDGPPSIEWLAPFFRRVAEVERDSKTREVINVVLSFQLDEGAFLAWWEQAGFPLQVGGVVHGEEE